MYVPKTLQPPTLINTICVKKIRDCCGLVAIDVPPRKHYGQPKHYVQPKHYGQRGLLMYRSDVRIIFVRIFK